MSLVQLCRHGDLEGVKAALQRGIDVNTKGEYGAYGEYGLQWTGLMWAVTENHNSVVELLLKTPNIDVNQKDDEGCCALHLAVSSKNIEALKLLLSVPNIDVNIVDTDGESAVHICSQVWNHDTEVLKLLLNVPNIDVNIVNNRGESAVRRAVMRKTSYNIEVLKLLLSHPSLTALTLNQKDKEHGITPVMLAVISNKLEHLELLAADLRVDLDTTDEYGRSLEEVAR